jgi:hypothetical protein
VGENRITRRISFFRKKLDEALKLERLARGMIAAKWGH